MSDRKQLLAYLSAATVMLLASAFIAPAEAQVLEEDFNTVTGTGGGVFFSGLGYGDTGIFGWDNGIDGEGADRLVVAGPAAEADDRVAGGEAAVDLVATRGEAVESGTAAGGGVGQRDAASVVAAQGDGVGAALVESEECPAANAVVAARIVVVIGRERTRSATGPVGVDRPDGIVGAVIAANVSSFFKIRHPLLQYVDDALVAYAQAQEARRAVLVRGDLHQTN